MEFIDYIRRCNRWNPADFLSFRVDGQAIGRVRPVFADHLKRFPDVFAVTESVVDLASGLSTPDARTAALREAVAALTADGVLPRPHGEQYAIVRRWGEAPAFLLDRRFVPVFGLKAFGIHVNGFVRNGDTLSLWIGRRALDKSVEPGKLDNMIAGGLPVGITPAENVIKEAAEEAGLVREIAARACPVGAITYCFEDALGLKPDTLFLYDLEMPVGLIPRNVDGEITEFVLMDVHAVAEALRADMAPGFKFNVSLVLIDFLMRHGILTPENQPDYLDLAIGLHTPL